jgi:hypothetical protein
MNYRYNRTSSIDKRRKSHSSSRDGSGIGCCFGYASGLNTAPQETQGQRETIRNLANQNLPNPFAAA